MLDKYGHETATALNRMLHAENIDGAAWSGYLAMMTLFESFRAISCDMATWHKTKSRRQ